MGQIRETTAQVADGKADPPMLAVEAQERLRHGQAHQFGLAEPGRAARPADFMSEPSIFTYSAVTRVSRSRRRQSARVG